MSNTNTYDKSFPVSWEEIHRNSKALAWRLSELKPYKGIIAVTRGGLVPAAIVARELDIRYKSNALKPRKKITMDVISEMNEDSKNIAIIGDRIFTDIIVGNRCNIQTILVKRLSKNGLPIKINLTLILEKMISIFLK